MCAFHIPASNRIAQCSLEKFHKLQKTGKPIHNHEWTVLSCILQYNTSCNSLDVVSLGTGTKCIGSDALSVHGDILNDSHAEVMARRGFIRYILNEMKHSNKSEILAISENACDFGKFKMNPNISFHFFTTHPPCGDASLFNDFEKTGHNCIEKQRINEKVVKSQTANELKIDCNIKPPSKKHKPNININTIDFSHSTGAKLIHMDDSNDLMAQILGEIRTKPGRGIRTLSLSCSDKLSRWNIMGIQGALLDSLLVEPIFLDSITFCGKGTIEAYERAIWKRWITKSIQIIAPFKIHHPVVQWSDQNFVFKAEDILQASPNSLVWCKVDKRQFEVAVSGRRQGITKKKLLTIIGRLQISKVEIFKLFLEILKAYPILIKKYMGGNDYNFNQLTYKEAKCFSLRYRDTWNIVRDKCFEKWTQKPNNLLNFKSS